MKEPTHVLQLLADYSTEGLDEQDTDKLTRLLNSNPQYDAQYFDFSAAALQMGTMTAEERDLPEALRNRVLNNAMTFLDPKEGSHRNEC